MGTTIFSRFLSALGVKHTDTYSDSQFIHMPFHTLFGLSKLCQTYGIKSEGLRLARPSDMSQLDTPFLAHTSGGMVIVLDYGSQTVTYDTQNTIQHISIDNFNKAADGIVFLAYPDENSIEPDYAAHLTLHLFCKAKGIAMWLLLAALVLFLYISNDIYKSIPASLLILIDAAGIFFSTLLVQKGMKIHNKTADRVCGVIEATGCDTVLETKASSFFGIFKWSEVGLTYFSVSLFTLLVFPQFTNLLAALNVCCLPFSVWSVWYQKFRAKAWCTMCLSVQSLLWLSFFCYLAGDFFHKIFPLNIHIFVLIASYTVVLLILNKVLSSFEKRITKDDPN
ncbi:MAG: vitamin K epoxide reductase family protein [Prevotella sp.]|nr:vitamin K epoxide reductase family protein [Bacteroides sp.]MCM1366233.1 vitamin K epoxide reductase family protein [Prevotella sp.]MCM1436362.1 vitamin K epoxide reductase family protein [Prevotella sp.]